MRYLPAAVHLLSLNVCGLPSTLRPMVERAREFCRSIDSSDVDVATFQEVWGRRTLAQLRAGLPSFRYLAWRQGIAGQPAGGLATFSRVPIGTVKYRSFWGVLPTAGGVRFRAKRAVNSMLQGVLVAELAGLGTVIANTHLTANKDGDWSAENRHHAFQRAQLGRLHRALRGVRRAGAELTIVAGDFNIASDGPLYPAIVDGGVWRDPFAAADPTTYHVEFLPPGSAAHRIDYVLVRGDEDRFPVLGSGVRFAEPFTLAGDERMYASDHVALTARVGLSMHRHTKAGH